MKIKTDNGIICITEGGRIKEHEKVAPFRT